MAQDNETNITDRPRQAQQHKTENNKNKPKFEDNIKISTQRKPLHMTTSQTTPTFKATDQSNHETQVTNQAERQMHNHVSGPPTWQNPSRDITAPINKKPNATACLSLVCWRAMCNRGYGATAARLTPDQKVGVRVSLASFPYVNVLRSHSGEYMSTLGAITKARSVCVCAFLVLFCKNK